MLKGLESITFNKDFINIVSDNEGSKYYIENEFHKAIGFRKLHLEVAEFSKNLKILHCVFFPDPSYDIPIFGLDLVKVNNLISAAIVDLSPVSLNHKDIYTNELNKVNTQGFSSKREIPIWGDIFSENVFFASLKNNNEQKAFFKIVDQYLSILIKLSDKQIPESNKTLIDERIYNQKKYCAQQMKNDKTSLVLLKYFDKKWVNKYIKEVLFDF